MELRGVKLINIGGESHVDRNFIYLRDDYGSDWQGKVLIKDCEIDTLVDDFDIYNFTYRNHDFGYKCYLPSTLIDNLTLTNGNEKTKLNFIRRYFFDEEPGMHLDEIKNIHHRDENFEEILTDFKNYNKTQPPEYIRLINNTQNIKLNLVDSPFFDETELEGNIVRD